MNTYRVGHPLAQRVLDRAKATDTPVMGHTFQLTGSGKNIAILVPFIGRERWLRCTRLSIAALQVEDHLLFSVFDDGGEMLDNAQCRRMFDLPATAVDRPQLPVGVAAKIDDITAHARQAALDEMGARNAHWFDIEIDKLEHWAEDRRATLKSELDERSHRRRAPACRNRLCSGMHLVSASALARLKPKAYAHFERNKQLYIGLAQEAGTLAAKYPPFDKTEIKVSFIAKMIFEIDLGNLGYKRRYDGNGDSRHVRGRPQDLRGTLMARITRRTLFGDSALSVSNEASSNKVQLDPQ